MEKPPIGNPLCLRKMQIKRLPYNPVSNQDEKDGI